MRICLAFNVAAGVVGTAVLLSGCDFFVADQQRGAPLPMETAVSLPPTTVFPKTTTAVLTTTATVPATTAVPAACTDSAALVNDVTIPDGSQLAPGVSFVKTWRIKNTGTCTWNGRYRLTFAGGNRLGSLAKSFPLDVTVAPGELVDLSMELVAPISPATYQGDWKLQNPQGQLFGVGRSSPFWVKIVVSGGQPTTISGLIYQDRNRNGVYDAGEALMGDREVRLLPGTACHVPQNVLARAFSEADGRYTFSGDLNGSYCVGLIGDNNLVDVVSVAITGGHALNNIDLRLPMPDGSINGLLWNDYCLTNQYGNVLDGDCVVDGNGDYHADSRIQQTESYISGVTILLQAGVCANNDAVPVTAVTDASGRYFFGELLPGVYCVSINATEGDNDTILLPGRWSSPVGGVWYQEVVVQQSAQVVNFGWDYQLK